jgi:hypothetical protein
MQEQKEFNRPQVAHSKEGTHKEAQYSPENEQMLEIFTAELFNKMRELIYKKINVGPSGKKDEDVNFNEDLNTLSEWVDRALNGRIRFADRNELYDRLSEAVEKKFDLKDKSANFDQVYRERLVRARKAWNYISKKSFTRSIE